MRKSTLAVTSNGSVEYQAALDAHALPRDVEKRTQLVPQKRPTLLFLAASVALRKLFVSLAFAYSHLDAALLIQSAARIGARPCVEQRFVCQFSTFNSRQR